MADYRNQVLQGRQTLDGNAFFDCEFKDAQLVYSGGAHPTLSNCKFSATRFVFEGEAASTMNLVRGMLRPESGLRAFALGMMPEVGGVAPIN